jgi:HEPN domain-containing protein
LTISHDYPAAAEKHLTDAELLLNEGHPDGAGYLSGYVVECVLKTYILIEQTRINPSDRHHKLNDLSQSALSFATIQNARTAKYPIATTAGHSMYDSNTGWRETLRYRPATTITDTQAREWFTEAEAVYSSIPQMKLDGLI